MFVLHIELKVKPASNEALKDIYAGRFYPAISSQEGFEGAQLLRSTENGEDYRLCLQFNSQASQQKWVATDLHQAVWPVIEGQCTEYAVKAYHSVER